MSLPEPTTKPSTQPSRVHPGSKPPLSERRIQGQPQKRASLHWAEDGARETYRGPERTQAWVARAGSRDYDRGRRGEHP